MLIVAQRKSRYLRQKYATSQMLESSLSQQCDQECADGQGQCEQHDAQSEEAEISKVCPARAVKKRHNIYESGPCLSICMVARVVGLISTTLDQMTGAEGSVIGSVCGKEAERQRSLYSRSHGIQRLVEVWLAEKTVSFPPML